VLTTNGSQLQRMASSLRDYGVKRINVSLDSLRPRRFRQLTRHGNLDQVLAGIDAAVAADFERIRINAVILKHRNEEMPLGRIREHDRALSFCSSAELRAIIGQRYSMHPLGDPGRDEGPARYFGLAGSASRLGFISPHSENFCHLCNRVRVTAEGRLLLCLGNEHSVDLRAVLRNPHYTLDSLKMAIVEAMAIKPERHHFNHTGESQILRFMNATGG
jgi:GTP 3',8-cyclase